MKPAISLCLAAGLAASGTLYGQAMLEYGVSIGRAGAAGAATGAGAAGIFLGLKGTVEQKPGAAQPRQATAEEIEKGKKAEKDSKSATASEAKPGDEKKEEKPAPASWDSGTLTTSHGFWANQRLRACTPAQRFLPMGRATVRSSNLGASL